MAEFMLDIAKISLLKFQRNSIDLKKCYPVEFHISKSARDKYDFDEAIFTATGNVIFYNPLAARVFAQKLNQHRNLVAHPEQAVSASEINAMGLIDEILHYAILLYRFETNQKALHNAEKWLEDNISVNSVDKTLHQFTEEFPPLAVYKKKSDIASYLKNETEGMPNKLIATEEMLMLWLANQNKAFDPYQELFDETNLKAETDYSKIMSELHKFFDTQPFFGPENQNLIDLLQAPARKSPKSLRGQLLYIIDNWGMILESELLKRLLGGRLDLRKRLLMGLDFIEEERFRFTGFGPGPSYVHEFYDLEYEPERFSQDIHWMPRVVIIAKSTLVWLDQLSKKYQRSITRLDQIPDEELDKLASWGFTGLWLIGLWERSKASKSIKQMCGNPEAESSAYSLYDYTISNDLGGEGAYQNLRNRCWQRGIRLASDMVPNHMAIDSKWVIEHPDWFVQLNYPPFPSYSFNGPNFSNHSDVGVQIEDHYFDRTDAAVVFKRADFKTGDTRYIYHGNDGTSFPWNDTAQLNFLNPETREAVIQTILHVARKFSIIRFDAAMTLAKRHYQRLWFPEPGKGGAIPSRAEHGMTKSEFNRHIPEEFWREVVERVAREVPDTLLLAEAFWMMEGYFVRSLGMHRVYNSAFMNMLKNEENKKYRYTVKNTLEFNPEVLKRYVNFMNNPDEETAIAQFGDGDKYFGVCILMTTMPGLPMFGHGQIEGFREKYGMEYRRAYHEEQENYYLIDRHYREIFPLLKKRHLFAEVENFLFYDFYTPDGTVNENVFAYSNCHGDERALVVYHNIYSDTTGWVKTSVAFTRGSELIQKVVGDGLGLPNDGSYYCIFRDYTNGLEYIRNCREIWDNGFYFELGAYKYHVFLDFRIVKDNEWSHYYHLTSYLEGRGTPNIEEKLREVYLRPLHHAFNSLYNSSIIREIASLPKTDEAKKALLETFKYKFIDFLNECKKYSSATGDSTEIANPVLVELEAALQLPVLNKKYSLPKSTKYKSAISYLSKSIRFDESSWSTLYGWLIVHEIGKIRDDKDYKSQSRRFIDEWLFGKTIYLVMLEIGLDNSKANQAIALIKLLTSHQDWFSMDTPKTNRGYHLLNHILDNQEAQAFLQVNRFENKIWFNKEAFEILVLWLFVISIIDSLTNSNRKEETIAKEIAKQFGIIQKWIKAEKASGYQVEKLLEGLKTKKSSKKQTKSKKS
jgi:glycosidase